MIERIAVAGAGVLVLKALKRHTESEVLSTHAFHLLYFLSSDANLVQRLVRIDFHKHHYPPQSPTPLQYTISPLSSPHHHYHQVSNDILDALSTNLENHAGYERMAEWGCRTVHNLASQQAWTKSRMRAAGDLLPTPLPPSLPPSLTLLTYLII